MIKFKADTGNGRTLLAFGLSQGNILKMLSGDPVLVDMEQMGYPGVDFMVFGDLFKDDAQLVDSLGDLIGDDTVVTVGPTEKVTL